jgi:hypothetical protein
MIGQQLNTFGTLLLTKWVNTGDKMIDSSLIALISVIALTAISYISDNWRKAYNMMIFYVYRVYRNPTDIANIPYSIDIYKYTDYNDYLRNNNYNICVADKISQYLCNNHCVNVIKLTTSDINKYIRQYAERSRLTCLYGKQTKEKIYVKNSNYNNDYCILPIGITNYGTIVYYESDPLSWSISSSTVGVLRSTSLESCEYILKHLCKEIYEEYRKDQQPAKTGEICGVSGGGTIYTISKIAGRKTFDTLFYPQKAELINLLTRFKNKTLYPPHIPIDNKLGILLYGPPGTGKTGTISAIANMLGRSILIINFTTVTTCAQLDKIMNPSDYHKYVYVFDEFDCILDVISGKPYEKKEEKSDWGQMLMFAAEDERKKIIEMMREGKKKDPQIDMSYLLSKLDGLESAEDRIIVATTNNPDKINPALMRPGRFDIKICLGLCTQAMVVDILTNFYKGDEKMRRRITDAKIQGGVYSPLELINMAIQTPNVDKLLKRLKGA